MLRQRHQHPSLPQDPGLFARDQRDRLAQPLHVIERNIGDHRNQRLHDVRRVQPPAHPHFEHRQVHVRLGKCLEGQSPSAPQKNSDAPAAFLHSPEFAHNRPRENSAAQSPHRRLPRHRSESARSPAQGAATYTARICSRHSSESRPASPPSNLSRWSPQSGPTETAAPDAPGPPRASASLPAETSAAAAPAQHAVLPPAHEDCRAPPHRTFFKRIAFSPRWVEWIERAKLTTE